MILLLTRGQGPMCVPLRLPATPAEIGEAYVKLDGIDTEHPTRVVSVEESPVRNLGQYLRGVQPDEPGVLDKLNRLAQRISNMTEKEQTLLIGALDCSSINGLEDILRVSEQTDEYLLIPHVKSDAELGRYIAVASQFNADPRFPEASWPYLDYEKIGAEYYAEHGGAYIYEGYVLRKGSGLKQQTAEPSQDDCWPEVIRLTVQGPQGECQLLLPGDEEYLDEMCSHMEVESFAETTIQSVEFQIPYAAELIPTDCIDVEDANELAFCIEGMQREDGELLKYLSVLSVCRPETMMDALQIARNIDDYERVPDDVEEYGKAVLCRIGADDEIIDTIDGYMDFAALGEASMEEDGVKWTRFGLVRRLSAPFPEETFGLRMGGI